ncbi:MAG: trans-4-hydroxy-L-proline dehydratase [Planctomycetota bacterium]|jgi:formate C-acetyltransferase
MNERTRRLRQQSVETTPYISAARAELVTDFYAGEAPRQRSVPVCRALALRHILEQKELYIGDGELIVGERGPAPKATPTFPELCCHSLEDLRILSTRRKTRFDVPDDVRRVYEEKIIPFWQGATMRERLFERMAPEWHAAFDAGVFTEFMEQRVFGHAILDDKIYHSGLLDRKRMIEDHLARLDPLTDPRAYEKREELTAMAIAVDAVVRFAERHAEAARSLAEGEADADRKSELLKIADVCSRVPAHAPRDFHEALQCYWFVHLGVIAELNTWDSFNPGRLDQHLMPFYEKGLADGSLTREAARELLGCFWVKFNNQPAPPKVGVTEEQSGTYTDFALINVGGLTLEGADAVNEVSHLILDVVEDMQLTQPSSCIQLSKLNPESFLKRACEIVRSGLGQPSMFNTDVILKEMLRDGKMLADARAGGPSGCVTVSAFGKESCTLTGYINWPKILELALNDGVDPRTGTHIGPETGDARAFESLDDVVAAYRRQLAHFVDVKIAGNNVIERLYANQMPAPFMSVIMDDCIAKGRDYHDGGARYNPTYIQGVGIGTLTDSLAAIGHHVFDKKSVGMAELLEATARDFGGDGHEELRLRLRNDSPAYGNDDDRADAIARRVFEIYFDLLDGRPNTKGGRYRVNLLPTTVHVYFGSVLGGTPNGRRAGLPVSEGISPSQGADRRGPTAVLKSAACIDHARTGGTLLNLRFAPGILEGEGLGRLAALVRTYFMLDGHHVQFNVFDVATLRRAQERPEEHRGLIVRVAGYSDYFVDVGRELQDEIISRTEHGVI